MNAKTFTLNDVNYQAAAKARSGASATEQRAADPAVGHMAWDGGRIGLLVGTALGAVFGLVLAIISSQIVAMPLPGSAEMLASGPLALAMLGAAAGAVNGGLAGALIGWGVPRELP